MRTILPEESCKENKTLHYKQTDQKLDICLLKERREKILMENTSLGKKVKSKKKTGKIKIN